jgi:hypothetical protein
MAFRAVLRPLVFALALASLAPAPAPAAAWQAGDVEAAERYRALERERALRYRAALEERAGAPERPAAKRERAARSERQEARAGREPRRALFEPWVEKLATRIWDALLEALTAAASSAWHELRGWLAESFHRLESETERAHRDWRPAR